jgi:ribosomal protein S11
MVKSDVYKSLFLFFLKTPLPSETLPLKSRRKVKLQKYVIIRLFINFTNLNFSVTTLTGKVLGWHSGGSLDQTRRTRLTARTVGLLLNKFLRAIRRRLRKKFVKIVFSGPSKRFRGKLSSMITKKARRFQMRILCHEEAFKSFNGCRLHRKKR